MSRIGNKPVELPGGVKVEIQGSTVTVSGSKGQLHWEVPSPIRVKTSDGQVTLERSSDARKSRELHGLSRALIQNMVRGVTEGYQKRLLVYGTGYGCNVKGGKLELNLGYMGRSVNKAPQFSIPIPEGVEVTVETPAARGDSEPAKMLIHGMDKQKVGQFAAEVRALRRPEPYKGKGVRYEGEVVKRKQGKAFTSGG